MKNPAGLFVGLLVLVAVALHAEETPRFVNTTFQEVLSRVEGRYLGKIIYVRAKSDSARNPPSLEFSMKRVEDDRVVVELSIQNMVTKDVYESYLLRIDDAVRAELENIARFPALEADMKRKASENRQVRLKALPPRTVACEMPQEQVLAILGKPSHKIAPSLQRAVEPGSCDTWVYSRLNTNIVFADGCVQSIEGPKGEHYYAVEIDGGRKRLSGVYPIGEHFPEKGIVGLARESAPPAR